MKEKLIVYPAVLDNSENSDDVYTVTFPDVPGAISEGKGLAQAMLNGSEALGLMLYDVDEMPEASNIDEVRAEYPKAVVTLIFTDLEDARRKARKPLVKKNTTIPSTLAQQAEERGINFSQTLTKALEEKLKALQ